MHHRALCKKFMFCKLAVPTVETGGLRSRRKKIPVRSLRTGRVEVHQTAVYENVRAAVV